jgi:hypothetical protein
VRIIGVGSLPTLKGSRRYSGGWPVTADRFCFDQLVLFPIGF